MVHHGRGQLRRQKRLGIELHVHTLGVRYRRGAKSARCLPDGYMIHLSVFREWNDIVLREDERCIPESYESVRLLS